MTSNDLKLYYRDITACSANNNEKKKTNGFMFSVAKAVLKLIIIVIDKNSLLTEMS